MNHARDHVSERERARLPANMSCHSFRATTATDLLDQGVPLEDVQYLLGHADPRKKEVTRNIVITH